MKRLRIAFIAACVFLSGCSSEAPATDVTPVVSASGGRISLSPLPPDRFEGKPTRIGFEPLPLEGADFPTVTGFAFLPNSDEALVVNRFGKVGWFRVEQERAVLLSSFQIPAVFADGDCGVGSIALDPGFANNGYFYVAYCIDAQYNVVKRYAMSRENFPDTLYTAANILAAGDPEADEGRNAVGTIAFASDGTMWAGMGDRHREQNAQDLKNEMGKIIRFVPSKKATANGYVPATGNPFAPQNALVYAYGFSNPRKGAFDARGRYWVADSGDGAYQEINVVKKAAQNFGWPETDGPTCGVDCARFVAPVRYWDDASDDRFVLEDTLAQSDATDRAAWVGIEYRPGKQDRYQGLLNDTMLYGDFYVGFVRGMSLDADGVITGDRQLGHLELPVAWQQAADGYLYAATMHGSSKAMESDDAVLLQGSLWRVVPLP